MRPWAIWLSAAAFLGVAAWFGYGALTPPVVMVAHPARGPAVEAAYATGTIEPTVMIPIGPRSTARLTGLQADEGERVMPGRVLARLEDDDLRSALAAARAIEANAKRIAERNAELAKSGRVSRQASEQASANWEAAAGEVARLEAQLGFLVLTAPVAGTVIRRDGEVGQLITVGTPVFWIAADVPLRISSEVDEEDIARISTGQKALIRADALPGEVFEGQVSSVTPKGDATARSYRVRIAMPQDPRFMTGMTAETNIVLRETQEALLVPTGALAGDAVWIVTGDRLALRKVTVGARGNERSEILSGLDDGAWVVTAPAGDFAEGMRVRAEPSG